MNQEAAAQPRPHKSRISPLATTIFAGVVIGIMEVYFVSSFVSLIFAGELAQYMPYGISLALFAQLVLLLVVALLSSRPGMIASVQDVPAVLLSVIAGALITTVQAGALLPTVLAALAVTTLLTGLTLTLVGWLKLGRLARFVPYPVVGGFIAATGVLLVQGGFATLTGYSLTFSNLALLAQPETARHWAPAVLFAVAFFVAARFVRWPFAVPVVLIGSIVVFYLLLWLTGNSLSTAQANGWLYTPGTAGISWQPLTPALLAAVDWGAIAGQAGNVAVVIGLTLAGVLFNVSGIEVNLRRQLDLNRELIAGGAANLVAGLGGGIIGYQSVGLTPLSQRLGGHTRLAGVVAGLVALATLLMGTSFLALVPITVVGGLLIYVGADFLYEWLVAGWRRFARPEYAIVVLMLAVIVATNFVVGALVGLFAMVVMFIVAYSRTHITHEEYTLADVPSIVIRGSESRRVLHEYGDRVQVLELQGFLFFGTANALLERVTQRLRDPDLPRLDFVVLDFRMVTGLDSSAALGFRRVEQVTMPEGVKLVLSGVAPALLQRLGLGGWTHGATAAKFRTLNEALEWCEDQVLARYLPAGPEPAPAELLAQAGLSPDQVQRLLALVQPLALAAGEILIHMDAPAEEMFFVLRGRVTAVQDTPQGRVRLRTLTAGTIVGEMAIVQESGRAASVVADQPTQVLRITSALLNDLVHTDPELAYGIQHLISRQLVDRLLQHQRSVLVLKH